MSARAFIGLLLFVGCGPTSPPCDATTCFGCCDTAGQCQPGAAAGACGSSGNLCDVCVGQQICALGRCQAPACVPSTCSARGLNCGQADDGCGGTLECGSCGAGTNCGGGGRANVCAPGVCTPRSCATLNADCGSVSDGCATLLSCGTCSAGSSCGLNAPNRCTCQPASCSSLGRNCGDVSDGCTGMLSCGTCSGGRTCGGGGTAGVCGSGSCIPKTCVELGKDCGSVSDGCGAMLACGACSGALTCGGAGTMNVCGGTCSAPCPGGFTCDGRGVCVGSSSSLVLDVIAVPVSGSLRLNGAVPARGPSCMNSPTNTTGFITFTNTTTGTQLRADLVCSSTNFDYALVAPPGTYQVAVYGFGPNDSNLPKGTTGVNPALVVAGPTTGLTLNVIAVPVSGSVKLNGAVPTKGPSCANSPTNTTGFVTFTDTGTGTVLRADLVCSSNNFDYALMAPPGTYQVAVYGFGPNDSNLPDGTTGVNPALVVAGPTTGLTLNVVAVPVSGSVKLNGAVPTKGPSCVNSPTNTTGFVTFTNIGTGTVLRADLVCSSTNFDYALVAPPGTYQVAVYGFGPNDSNLPRGTSGVNPALVVAGPTTGLTLNVLAVPVSGSVKLNGAVPTKGASCANSPTNTTGFVTFTNTTTGTQLRADLVCSSTNFDYALVAAPGTYRVTVYGFGANDSNLPKGTVGVKAAQVISGPTPGLTLNVLALPVQGSVRLNGAVPTKGPSCVNSPTNTTGFVTFSDASTGTQLRADLVCSSANFDFALAAPPGTYQVTVYGFGPNDSNLPRGTAGVVSQLRLQ